MPRASGGAPPQGAEIRPSEPTRRAPARQRRTGPRAGPRSSTSPRSPRDPNQISPSVGILITFRASGGLPRRPGGGRNGPARPLRVREAGVPCSAYSRRRAGAHAGPQAGAGPRWRRPGRAESGRRASAKPRDAAVRDDRATCAPVGIARRSGQPQNARRRALPPRRPSVRAGGFVGARIDSGIHLMTPGVTLPHNGVWQPMRAGLTGPPTRRGVRRPAPDARPGFARERHACGARASHRDKGREAPRGTGVVPSERGAGGGRLGGGPGRRAFGASLGAHVLRCRTANRPGKGPAILPDVTKKMI